MLASRRGFLAGLGALFAAPAVVRVESLMPVRGIVMPVEMFKGGGLLQVTGNRLTSLAPDLYDALDVISRELVGFIPSVSLNPYAERVALDQTIRNVLY